MKRTILLFLIGAVACLAAGSAQAANNWTLTLPGGSYIVMGVSLPLVFTVANDAASDDEISEVEIFFNHKNDFSFGTISPPTGWEVSWTGTSGPDRGVRMQASTCGNAISQGSSAEFTLNLIWESSAADVSKSVADSDADARSGCSGGGFNATADPSFTIKGLDTSLSADPSALGVGSSTTVALTATNKTTGALTVSPSALGEADGTVFTCSAASPASQSIASGTSGDFTWSCTADASGSETFSASASATGVTSPTASASVEVGDLTATMAVTPTSIIGGDTVSVKLTVKNNGASPVYDVTPNDPPTTSGTATTMTKQSGPNPSSVASLSAGQSATFTWTYLIDGSIGQTYAFSGYASDNVPVTTNTATSETGSISEYSVTISPTSVVTGTADQAIEFTVTNDGGYNVDHVEVAPSETSLWSFDWRTWDASDTTDWTATENKIEMRGIFDAGTEISSGGGSETFTAQYSAGSTEADTTFQVTIENTNNATTIMEVDVTLADATTPPPNVDYFTGSASSGTINLYWGNPTEHDGVVAMVSTASDPSGWCGSATPTNGQSYTTGQTVCSAAPVVDVAYYDSASYATSFTDSSASNGSTYYFKIHNHDEDNIYADGAVPSSRGINLTPNASCTDFTCWKWQYALGGAAIAAPPAVLPGGSIFANTNTDLIVGIDADLGTQLWTPYTVTGNMQSRYAVVPVTISAATVEVLFASTDAGNVYAINASTGTLIWSKDLDVDFGRGADDGITAAPVVQVYEYANAAFTSSGYPASESAVFVATNNTSTTDNVVHVLKASDGSQMWYFDPGVSMDGVSGVPMIDYDNNRLYFTSGDGGASQNTVWAISTLYEASSPRATTVWTQAYGSSDFSISSNSDGSRLYFGNDSSELCALSPTDGSKLWTNESGSCWKPSSETGFDASYDTGFVGSAWHDFAVGYTDRIYVSTQDGASNGRVWALDVASGGLGLDDYVWSTSLADPSFPLPLAYAGVNGVFVGSSDGYLYKLHPDTGATSASLDLGSGTVGNPGLDHQTDDWRVIVGTGGGNVYSVIVHKP